MENLNLYGIQFNFDRSRTAEVLAANRMTDWCQCDQCTNGRVATAHFMPTDLSDALRAMGFNPQRGFHREPEPKKELVNGWYWSNAYWPVVGSLHGTSKEAHVSEGARIEIVANFGSSFGARSTFEDLELPQTPDLHFLKVSTFIPWIPKSVGELRYRSKCQPCRKCGCEWRWNAYVKRRSQLPDWYGCPEVRMALRRPKTRVFATFCLDCGDLNYQLAPNHPSLLIKTKAERIELKRLKRFLKKMRSQSKED